MSKIDDKLNEVLGIAEVDKTYENEVLPKKMNTGRVIVAIQFSIRNNSNTSQIKFTGTETFEA